MKAWSAGIQDSDREKSSPILLSPTDVSQSHLPMDFGLLKIIFSRSDLIINSLGINSHKSTVQSTPVEDDDIQIVLEKKSHVVNSATFVVEKPMDKPDLFQSTQEVNNTEDSEVTVIEVIPGKKSSNPGKDPAQSTFNRVSHMTLPLSPILSAVQQQDVLMSRHQLSPAGLPSHLVPRRFSSTPKEHTGNTGVSSPVQWMKPKVRPLRTASSELLRQCHNLKYFMNRKLISVQC